MAKHKKKKSSYEHETIEYQGVKQEYISPENLPKRMRKLTRHSGTDSFLLEDGRYAYLETDEKGKHKIYRVLTIPNQKLLRFLDYWDKDEESLNRRNGDNAIYLQINHQTYAAQGDDHASPIDIECYKQWKKADETESTPAFPLKSEYAVIHSMIHQLPPSERGVYGLLYDGILSEAEIKTLLGISSSAWWNQKTRMLERFKRIFTKLGYTTPGTQDVLTDEDDSKAAEYEKRMSQDDERIEAEYEERQWAREIASERSRIESYRPSQEE